MMRLVATVALVLALHFPPIAESFQGRVVAITDGDTIRVLRGTEQVRVGLLARIGACVVSVPRGAPRVHRAR